MRGDADRPADIAAHLDRDIAGGEAGGRPARTAARRARGVERVVRPAVDRVDRLPVAEPLGQVGLAEDDRARRLQPAHHLGIARRNVAGVLREAPVRRQPLDVEGFLHRHRHAKQRHRVGGHRARVDRVGGGARAVEVADDDGVDRAVARLDPRDRRFGFGACAGLARPDRGGGGERGPHGRAAITGCAGQGEGAIN